MVCRGLPRKQQHGHDLPLLSLAARLVDKGESWSVHVQRLIGEGDAGQRRLERVESPMVYIIRKREEDMVEHRVV